MVHCFLRSCFLSPVLAAAFQSPALADSHSEPGSAPAPIAGDRSGDEELTAREVNAGETSSGGTRAAENTADNTDGGETEGSTHEAGFWLRVVAERARIRTRFDFEGEWSSNLGQTSFARTDWNTYQAWGGRAEVGAFRDLGSGVALVPRGAVSLLVAERVEHDIDVAGILHRWRSRPWWWSVSGGLELRALGRIWGAALDVGAAGIHANPTMTAPSGAEVEALSINAGGLVRLSSTLTLPLPRGLGVGVLLAAEGYVWPLPFKTQVGGKTSLGLGVEWHAE